MSFILSQRQEEFAFSFVLPEDTGWKEHAAAEAGLGLGSDAATGSRGHAGNSLSSKSKTLKIGHKVLKKKPP